MAQSDGSANQGSIPASAGIRIVSAKNASPSALMRYAVETWDRPRDDAYLTWRYQNCPALDGAVAMVGDECVASMFALQREYFIQGTIAPCLEPLEWYANPRYRAIGAGLRVTKHLMNDGRPMIGLGGTHTAVELLQKLGWTQVGKAARYVLPLRGRYLRHRGRSATVSTAFDVILRHRFSPARSKRTGFSTHIVTNPSAESRKLVETQKRFAVAPAPSDAVDGWLNAAPPVVGQVQHIEFRLRNTLVGWALTRTYSLPGVRYGSILQLFLADEAREFHKVAIDNVGVLLARNGADAITATTSCPDTLSALQEAHYRLDEELPIMAWWGRQPRPEGQFLVMGSHADFAFFPLATATA